jgi:hypothetical protein
LSLITDAFGYGTKAIPTDANATFTMPDATADGTRAMYLKITSSVSLSATRTVTLGPNTISKVWIIENATTGSQSITISQGSGSTVTITNGAKVMVYTDGAGATAAVVSANPTAASGGDVVGPASATDNAIARFDLTTGKLIQNSAVYISDTGTVGIGSTPLTQVGLYISRTITGATVAWNAASHGSVASDVTAQAYGFDTLLGTAASAFTLSVLTHYSARANTFGVGSAVTTQIGFGVESSLTGATNNYGFYGSIASGTGRWNLYMNGTANNYINGALGIGTTNVGGTSGISINLARNMTGATTSLGMYSPAQIQSDVTNTAIYFYSFASTQAAAFTLANLRHFQAQQSTFGATSAVTAQSGFFVDSTLTGATNNYGFYGNIASGTGRWNLYMSGTAENYLAGNLKVGATTARGTTAGTNHISLFNGTAPAGTLTNGVTMYSASGDLSFMDSAGNGYKVGYRNLPAVGTKTGSYTLATGDVGKYVQVGSGGSITIPDATFAEGDAISIFNNTTGNITITCSITTAYISGTDTDKATMTLATRGVATVLFISGTVCVVSGSVT